jgi:hypothetical protein
MVFSLTAPSGRDNSSLWSLEQASEICEAIELAI